MSAQSKIEWTNASWTPIRARDRKTGKVGWHCEHVTTGCEHCYAESMNKRLGTGLPFKPGHRKDIDIFLDGEMLTAPLRWRKPRMIFVCSMTDLFADFVKDEWIDKMFAVMALCPQHTFQVLTKRAERMREYCSALYARKRKLINSSHDVLKSVLGRIVTDELIAAINNGPLPNVWLGVSCERQQEADERIPLLLQTPAAIRFISAEPLLGPIDLQRLWHFGDQKLNAFTGNAETSLATIHLDYGKLDWVIAGGESGPNARPMHPDWARSLRDQCAAASVPFFFKQWGEWAEAPLGTRRVGKKRAGRLLDGREHNEFPGQPAREAAA